MANKDMNIPKEAKLDPAQTIPPTPIILQQQKDSDFDNAGSEAGFLRNIAYSRPLELAGLVDYVPGQVASKTLVQNPHVGITLFAMAAGEGISAHKSTGDAFVAALEGQGEITIDDNVHALAKGQCIVMPAGHPHAVKAKDNFKMLLVVVFPSE